MTGYSGPSGPIFPDRFRVTLRPPGFEPVDITRKVTAAQWTSAVPGGFENAVITLPLVLTQKERGLLGLATIEHDGRVLFEGRVEDAIMRGDKSSVSTDLQCFGLQRLLTDNSLRRIWSVRNSLAPNTVATAKGSSTFAALALKQNSVIYSFGRFNSADPTRFGFRIAVIVALVGASGDCGQVGLSIPNGLSGVRVMFDAVVFNSAGGSIVLDVHSSADGTTYTRHLEQLSSPSSLVASFDVALVSGAVDVRFAYTSIGAGGTPDAGGTQQYVEVSNLRIIGTALREDTAGGFYGGTILRDVVAQCPGLYPGTVEDGSDFVLAEINRVNRTSCLDVVNQITPLYAREWAIWEGGRFDWITPDLKSPGWVVPLDQTTSWQIEQSLDTLHKRTYVTFQDAADQQFKEAFADSGQARNPYVRTGATKDGVVPAPAAMTSITAPLLAAKLNNDFGRWPGIKGQVTLPAASFVEAANGVRSVPAFAIRAGDNITINDLPVEDIYTAGQDGQTVFHVTGVQTATTGDTQLTLEGLTRRADVLMARLGAVSQ